VANESSEVVLSKQDLRQVTSYAAESAQEVLEIFARAHPADPRPRDAIDAAWAFARGGERGKSLRDAAWAANRAAREAATTAAGEAARAAMCAASAAYLHPLADAHQVKHILGAAAHAARASELMAGDDRDVGADHIEQARLRATPGVVDVLSRYPAAPPGGGRVGELLRGLDAALRGRFLRPLLCQRAPREHNFRPCRVSDLRRGLLGSRMGRAWRGPCQGEGGGSQGGRQG
jgi:hypothetical protein